MVEEYRIEQMPELINKIKTAIDSAEGVPVTKTATGNPIEITDGADCPLVKCVSAITGYQEGSGTPSPDNIRPIVAYTEGKIEVSDGDGNVTTHITTYPTSIYRGSEDCVGGSVVCEKKKITISGDVHLYGKYGSDNANLWYYDTSDIMAIYNTNNASLVDNRLISNMYTPITTQSEFSMRDFEIRTNALDTINRLFFRDSRFSTATEINTYLSSNPLEVVYKLATPTTSSVTPTNLPIKSLSGYNHIESSTGEMKIEYFTSKLNPFIDLVNNITADAGKVVYSTTERAIGTWTDGNILYEKTIVSEQALTDTWANYAATTGMDVIVSVDPRYTRDGEEVSGSFSNTELASWIHRDGYIKVCTPTDSADWKIESMTIRYTKSAS